MESLFYFTFPACGLFWVLLGIFLLWPSSSSDSDSSPKPDEATSDDRKDAESPTDKSVDGNRRVGAVWLCLGLATLWYSDLHFGPAPTVVIEESEAKEHPITKVVYEYVERDIQKRNRVGLIVGAVSGDQEVLLGFGKQQLGGNEPVDGDTVFEIGSISKVFTGILLAQQIEGGKLKLDDRVADLLPEGWSLSEEAQELTLRHLTTHTSGFPRLPANIFTIGSFFQGAGGGDPYRAYSEEQFREALADGELEYEPGTEERYSNFAVGLLGYVLGVQNGTDYETLVRDQLCKPLGLEKTVITNSEWHENHWAVGYRSAIALGPIMLGSPSAPWELPNHLAGAGGIRSIGPDMMLFLKANMGQIQSPVDASINRSHQELYKSSEHSAVGMNWQRTYYSTLSQNVIWHNGGTGGYSTYLGFTEDKKSGGFVLANSIDDVDGRGFRILLNITDLAKDADD